MADQARPTEPEKQPSDREPQSGTPRSDAERSSARSDAMSWAEIIELEMENRAAVNRILGSNKCQIRTK